VTETLKKLQCFTQGLLTFWGFVFFWNGFQKASIQMFTNHLTLWTAKNPQEAALNGSKSASVRERLPENGRVLRLAFIISGKLFQSCIDLARFRPPWAHFRRTKPSSDRITWVSSSRQGDYVGRKGDYLDRKRDIIPVGVDFREDYDVYLGVRDSKSLTLWKSFRWNISTIKLFADCDPVRTIIIL
jgi:hypothetical protein